MLENLIVNNRFESAKYFNEKNSKPLTEELMNLFNKGNRQKFMDLFNLLRKQSKLQFYLRVYFLIFHIHPSLKAKSTIPQEQIHCFKQFIDNRGAQLAKTNQFLQFYALPYIKKPLEHLAFKNLFKKQWSLNLKQKLKLYLSEEEKRIKYEASKLFENPNSPSKISQSSSHMNEKIKEMEHINKKLFQEVKQFKERYQFLEESHKSMIEGFHSHMMESQSKWFQIVKELVGCSKSLIEMTIKAQSPFVNDRRFIKVCKRTEKYEKFVNKKFDDLISQSQDISIFQKPSMNQISSYSISQKNMTGMINLQDYVPTDYEAMKRSFWRKDSFEKISILNGLFWRIAKCKDIKSRRMNIIGILRNDFLGLQSGHIDELLGSRQLMKPTLRLLYSLTMDKYGRSVVFTNTSMYRDIISLIGNCSDETCLQYIMVIIQFLSAQSNFKKDLLNNDIISIFMGLLRDDKISRNEVIVQNIVASLLNLTDREQGIRIFRREVDIFQVMIKFLETDYMITKVIIYAIIYALLEDQFMFNLAHKEKLPQFIHYITKKNPHSNRKQIQPIKQKLKHFEPKSKRPSELQVPNGQEEEDVYEYDIEEDSLEEYMKDHQEIIKQFSFKGKEAKKQISQIKQIYEEYNENKLPKFYEPQVKYVSHNEKMSPQYKYHSPKNKEEQPLIKQKLNNYLTNEPVRKNPNFRIKENQQRSYLRENEDTQNKKVRKSTSVDKFDRKKQQKIYYQGSSRQKPKQLKPIDERSYRSPQNHKKSRQQVLKQLNDQLKASEQHKSSSQKQKKKVQPVRQNRLLSKNNGNEVEAFQSKPKLRRTPPDDDD